MRKSVKAYLREKKNSKCYSCIIKWEEDGISKSKEISTGIEIKGIISVWQKFAWKNSEKNSKTKSQEAVL